jgi:hypothetical protein
MVKELRSEPEVGVRSVKKVSQFEMVSGDVLIHFKEQNRTFRILLYGAYNAFGLIGPEMNGIAVLDQDNKLVLTDGLARADSGYFGPTRDQVRYFNELVDADWETLKTTVENSGRYRGDAI